jgi:hypothetical protein
MPAAQAGALTCAPQQAQLETIWTDFVRHSVHILSSVGSSVANASITGAPLASNDSRV